MDVHSRRLERRALEVTQLEAEEPSSLLQHAVRLPQRCVDVRDVPDAERDRVGVNAATSDASGPCQVLRVALDELQGRIAGQA